MSPVKQALFLIAALLPCIPVSAQIEGDSGTAKIRAVAQVAAYKSLLDIDDDGQSDALSDALLVMRYLLGLRGESLISGAANPAGNRKTAAEIELYLQGLLGIPPTGFTPAVDGCTSQTLEANFNLSGYAVDRYGWADADCLRRTAALVRNNAVDPGGSRGGYLRELTLSVGGNPRVAKGTGASGFNGWGYVVSNYGASSDTTKGRTGTFRTVLAGSHHSIHEFKVSMSPGGPVDVTIHWFFATGRSEPVFAITFDSTPAGPNVVNADTRAPYGDFAFEGAAGPIAGLGWGDLYRFTTTGPGPVSFSTPWDYTQTNAVPYVRMWSSAIDAEMGAVQTQTFAQHVAGGDYGFGVIAQCQGHTSASPGPGCVAAGQSMPQDYLWPFQLNQYELPFTDSSHRIAWGSSFGAVGQTSVSAFGRTFAGYPTFSYAVMLVIDPHSANPVLARATAIERMTGAQVSGATWNPTYAVWDAPTTANASTISLNPVGGPVTRPIFRFTGFTGTQVSQLTLNGVPLVQNVGYFATLDPQTQTAWVTLNGTLTAPMQLHLQ